VSNLSRKEGTKSEAPSSEAFFTIRSNLHHPNPRRAHADSDDEEQRGGVARRSQMERVKIQVKAEVEPKLKVEDEQKMGRLTECHREGRRQLEEEKDTRRSGMASPKKETGRRPAEVRARADDSSSMRGGRRLRDRG